MKQSSNKKMFYLFLICISLSIVIIGATFAYFTASVKSNDITGKSATTGFNLDVERVTTIDLINGLIPMKNEESPNAAVKKCADDYGYAGCQIYKITITITGEDEISIDGYIITNKQDGVDTRFSRVYTDDNETTFYTEYTTEDFEDSTFVESSYIKTGNKNSSSDENLNPNDDYESLFISNETLSKINNTKTFYVMLWAYDNGTSQDELQGMKDAFTGEVIFQTSYGNEIKATFS